MLTPKQTSIVDSLEMTPAAEYVRMSTDHQKYSTANQQAAIRKYALARGCEVIRTYMDKGKSGLQIRPRHGLQSLLEDVQKGDAPFEVILVYDVSRWGRFQDTDESAYYEYLCRRSGIKIAYCAETFENDGSVLSSILKNIKRAMAAEFSRELSVKVFAGQCRLTKLGFYQSGIAGFGLRRMLVDEHGNAKGLLSPGQAKSISSDHVILVPGPASELKLVAKIYRWFSEDQCSISEIACRLNKQEVNSPTGRPWTHSVVRNVLTNEKYVGVNVFARRSKKLGTVTVRNPREQWIRKEDAFKPIVSKETFEAAQNALHERTREISDAEIIERLTSVYESEGYLTPALILDKTGLTTSILRHRFGGRLPAYALAGYLPARDRQYLEAHPPIKARRDALLAEMKREIENRGGTLEVLTGLNLRINGQFTVHFQAAACRFYRTGSQYWRVNFSKANPDLRIVFRLGPLPDVNVLDFFFFPHASRRRHFNTMESLGEEMKKYQQTTLSALYEMVVPSAGAPSGRSRSI